MHDLNHDDLEQRLSGCYPRSTKVIRLRNGQHRNTIISPCSKAESVISVCFSFELIEVVEPLGVDSVFQGVASATWFCVYSLNG